MSESTPLYAIVDIETTGGRPTDTKIMEIAICISDGKKILSEYSCLINPKRKIDYYVRKLTGITEDMVTDQKTFEQKAGEILQLLDGKIFVAHNVDFDYSIVRREFLEIGKPFEAQKLCTVKSARKVFPGYSSYSLGSITSELGIPLTQAHRALDDARATAELMHKILIESNTDFLKAELNQQNFVISLPLHWQIHENKAAEARPGVIYFHDEKNDFLYITSTDNVQKKLYKYILLEESEEDNIAKRIFGQTRFVSLDYVSDAFKAEIKMLNDIQMLKPRMNKIMKPQGSLFVMHLKKDEHDLYYLNIVRKANMKDEVDGPLIHYGSFRSAEKVKNRFMYSQDMQVLPNLKRQILKANDQIKLILVKEYNDHLTNKLFKEFSCAIRSGYYVMSIDSDKNVECIKVMDYYIQAWGQGVLTRDNKVIEFKAEFEFDTNQKFTRKFLNILPKVSHRICMAGSMDEI